MKLRIVDRRAPSIPSGRKIVFEHKRALGDAIMFSAGIRDFKLLFPELAVGVDSNQAAVWENNPYIDWTLRKGQEGVEHYQVGYSAVTSANNTYVHFTQMFLLDMIAAADLSQGLPMSLGEFCAAFSNGEVGDPDYGTDKRRPEAIEPFKSVRAKYRNFCEKFSRMRGDIHLSDEEKSRDIVRDMYGVTGPYWVISPGGKRDATTKIWDWRRFQAAVDHFEGRIKFVVIGMSDLLVEPLRGVLDFVDKFNQDVRGLFSVIYHAEGCVSGPSFLMHAAAAIPMREGKARRPCVTILGGREPTGWTWYTHHQILHTNGAHSCCDTGGCWLSRVYPVPKDPQHNRKLCARPVECDGRTVQSCMDTISGEDVIRAISKYYEGDLYRFESGTRKIPAKAIGKKTEVIWLAGDGKQINLLGNLHVDGGGEQSLCMIARVLDRAGWRVNLYSWRGINDKVRGLFQDIEGVFMEKTFEDGMVEDMADGIPLLFYANDTGAKFCESGQGVVGKSSDVIVGINYVNRPLVKCGWLAQTGKVRAFVFQNDEKRHEFEREAIGFEDAEKIVLFGAINLDRFLEVCTEPRKKDGPIVVLKHCVPDFRKYVTSESEKRGEKIHLWQKHLGKDRDVKLYGRLLKEIPKARFEFMQAHEELVKHFRDEKRMVFHGWDSMPVTEFLSRGHVYLYRTSNLWRDQYPRVVGEALAAGLPVIAEPRDGTRDRVVHGDTGFYAVDYDGIKYALKLLERKEAFRYEMGRNAKDWARMNLDPRRWADLIEGLRLVGHGKEKQVA